MNLKWIYFSFLSLFLSSFAFSEQVQVTSPLPLPIYGAITNSTNTPVNVTCVSGCSSGSGGSSTTTVVNTVNVVSTYTVVTTTSPQQVFFSSSGVNASTAAVTNVSGQNLNVNIAAGSIANTGFNVNNLPATTTTTFNGVSQPVFQTQTSSATPYIGNAPVTTSNPIPVQTTGTVSVSGTFFQTTQPVTQSGTWGSTVTFNGAQPVTQSGVWGATVTFNGSQQVYSTSTVMFATVTANTVGMSTGSFNYLTQTGTGTLRQDLTTWGNGTTLSTTNPLPVQSTGTMTVGTHAVTQGNSPWSVTGGTMSVLIYGTSNTVSMTGFPLVPTGPNASTTTIQTNGASITTSNPIPTHDTGTVTINGSIGNTGFNVNNSPNVFVSTISASISGSSNTVNAQEVSGTRWNVSFSTAQTTNVFASTKNVTNVAVSTPVAAVASQTVRVFRLLLTVDAATTINFQDQNTNFGDQYPLLSNGTITFDLTNEPWYVTSSGNGFQIKQSGTANISYAILYTQS